MIGDIVPNLRASNRGCSAYHVVSVLLTNRSSDCQVDLICDSPSVGNS